MADQLVRATDGGATWTSVAAAPEKAYPAIYVVCYFRGVHGIYRSIVNNAVTWTPINNGYPLGSFDLIKTIEGDANSYGTVYIELQGSGFAYGVLR